MNQKYLLIIDAGHTRTKFSLFLNNNVEHFIVPNKPFQWSEALKKNNNDFECLLIGTNQHQNQRILAHLKTLHPSCEPCVLGKDIRVPIESCTAAQTGSDRLAQAYGARLYFPNNSVLIISAGSALVIDYVDQDIFKGGLIGIGLKNYKEAMEKINSQLVFDTNVSDYPAQNTKQAVSNGWFKLLVSTVAALKKELQPDMIVITGGDSEVIKKIIPDLCELPFLGSYAMAHAMHYYKIRALKEK